MYVILLDTYDVRIYAYIEICIRSVQGSVYDRSVYHTTRPATVDLFVLLRIPVDFEVEVL